MIRTAAMAAAAIIAVAGANATTGPEAGLPGGWDALAGARFRMPRELLGYSETAPALHGLARRAGMNAADIVPETTEARTVGSLTLMEGCLSGTCEERAMLVGNASSRTFYAARKPRVGRTVVIPELKEWPPEAKLEAIAWIKKAQ
jgi:hypothetical protein